MSDDVKLCPFCGIEPTQQPNRAIYHPVGDVDDWPCILAGEGYNEEDWNNRAPLASPGPGTGEPTEDEILAMPFIPRDEHESQHTQLSRYLAGLSWVADEPDSLEVSLPIEKLHALIAEYAALRAAPPAGPEPISNPDILRLLKAVAGGGNFIWVSNDDQRSLRAEARRLLMTQSAPPAGGEPSAPGAAEEIGWLFTFKDEAYGGQWVGGFQLQPERALRADIHGGIGGMRNLAVPVPTNDPQVAIRFSRRVDAEKVFLTLDKIYQDILTIEEHMWLDAARSAPTTEGQP